MRIHTGETLAKGTPDWDWTNRKRLGQEYLHNLALSFLNWYESNPPDAWLKKEYDDNAKEIVRNLELDGYVYRDRQLYAAESDVLDVEEEKGVLEQLYNSLQLDRSEEAFQFLDLSEQHYVAERWEDCIANARKFFELSLQQCASRYSIVKHSQPLPTTTAERPVRIRGFLEQHNLLEKKEREMVDKTYGLLSHTGSHPYMAKNDQARLLRQMALTVTQFVMLRTEGSLKSS